MMLASKNEPAVLRAKKWLALEVSDMMQQGMPACRKIIKRPPLYQLLKADTTKDTRKEIHTTLYLLIKDFCNSVNVVRNMDDYQMVDAATFLLDECYDYRLEDYAIMFTMAKRGNLVNILDRIDIQVIGEISKAYWAVRDVQIERIEQEEHRKRKAQEFFIPKPETPEEIEASNRFGQLVELLKQAPGYEQAPLGTRVKEQLGDLPMNDIQEAIRRRAERQLQTREYAPGLRITWLHNCVGPENSLVGVTCTGKIVEMKGGGMRVCGTTPSGQDIEAYLSINDLTIKIIK